MNSLGDLREFFEKHNREVTEFTGFSMTAIGSKWELAHKDPIRDGKSMSEKEWKDFAKSLEK